MDPDDSTSPPSREVAELGRWPRLGLATLPILDLLLALWAIRIPYFVLEPGPAQEVEFFQPNAYEAISAWLNPHDHVVRQDELLTPGQSQGQYIRQGLSQMDASKIDATVVALTNEVGYPKNHGPGVLIESVLPDAPATNRLFPGDLVTHVNGQPVDGVDQVSAAIKG